jgi:outer membrane biosynthesis protein TonB
MYLDLEDYRPDTPRVPSVISIREGVLLSLVLHAVMLLVIVFGPPEWFEAAVEPVVPVPANRDQLKYVQMLPAIDKQELAKLQAELSDIDRRSATRERAPVPENQAPLSRGNTPEKVVGGPQEPPEPAASPPSPPPAEEAVPSNTAGLYSEARPPAPPTPPAPNVGRALRNLQRYLQDNNYDNALGGATDQNADIQFDAKGADFGPWLRRFVAQVRRNWLIPQVAELARGHVVIQFTVLRNGAIVDLRVTQPAAIDALTVSALNSIKLSNPTAALPADYPDDRAPFIVTFRYNEPVRESPR